MKRSVRILCILLCVLSVTLSACRIPLSGSVLSNQNEEPTNPDSERNEEPSVPDAPEPEKSVSLNGFDDEDDFTLFSIDAEPYQPSPYYTPIVVSRSYYTLTDEEQKMYRALLWSLYSVSDAVDNEAYIYGEYYYRCAEAAVDGIVLSEAEIELVVRALYDDHPEIFWISNYFDYISDEEENFTAVRAFSMYGASEINRSIKKIREITNEFISSVPASLSAYEREKAVHDYIIDRCEYEESDEKDLQYYHSIYGVFLKNSAVCEGYALAFQMLLNLLGVECVGITGVGTSDSDEDEEDATLHMWNAVRLREDWYYVDVTWDDDDDIFVYDYFNLDESAMTYDHENSPLASTLSEDDIIGDLTYGGIAMNLFVPDCDSMTYNYYVYECPHLYGYHNTKAIEDALYHAALNEDDRFFIYVDPTFSSAEDAYNDLTDERTGYLYEWIEAVNGRLDGVRLSDDPACGYDSVLSYVYIYPEYTETTSR